METMHRHFLPLALLLAIACGSPESDVAETGAGADTLRPEQTAPDTTPTVADTAMQPAPSTDATRPTAAPPRASRGTTPADSSAQGVVRVVGADPLSQVVLQTTVDGARVRVGVTGPLRAELGQLVGAEVRVWGPAVPNRPPTPPRAIDVSRYEIVSVNGERPHVGELVLRVNGMWLISESEMRLANVPDDLSDLSGAWVWIVGPVRGEVLTVQTYGIIRRP